MYIYRSRYLILDVCSGTTAPPPPPPFSVSFFRNFLFNRIRLTLSCTPIACAHGDASETFRSPV